MIVDGDTDVRAWLQGLEAAARAAVPIVPRGPAGAFRTLPFFGDRHAIQRKHI